MSTMTSRLLAAAVSVLALAAGCADPAPAAPAGPAAPATASASDAAAWTDKFCGAIVTFQDAAKKQPQIDQSSPKKALAGLRTYIDEFTAAIDAAVTDLTAAGPAPVPAGDAAVSALTQYLDSARGKFVKAKAALDAAKPSDPSSILAVSDPLSGLQDPPDTLTNLSEDPQLDVAAAQAPNCKRLNAPG